MHGDCVSATFIGDSVRWALTRSAPIHVKGVAVTRPPGGHLYMRFLLGHRGEADRVGWPCVKHPSDLAMRPLDSASYKSLLCSWCENLLKPCILPVARNRQGRGLCNPTFRRNVKHFHGRPTRDERHGDCFVNTGEPFIVVAGRRVYNKGFSHVFD
ncbi:hypothetical protein Fmac_008339 [Flemingia macrophylla]|uniref:Uncharacterized protein n=1 Tax=Flemingia macrophylla TaxID=520843 RepID=A0ABD1MX44_9FABA